MPATCDGPSSPQFVPLAIRGNVRLAELAAAGVSKEMAEKTGHAPTGRCISWGLPFKIGSRVVLIKDQPVTVKLPPTKAQWLIFMHAADIKPLRKDRHGFVKPPMRGSGRLGEPVADYCFLYADGCEQRVTIRRRHQIGMFARGWGENCVGCVAHAKPRPRKDGATELNLNDCWGETQTRVDPADRLPWINWIWPWENPDPRKAIVGVRVEPTDGPMLISAISAGKASSLPVRWQSRQKAVLTLPRGQTLDPAHDDAGLLSQIQLDLGQVISATPRPVYPDSSWPRTYNNKLPQVSPREVLVEYTAHPDARFYLPGGRTIPVTKVERNRKGAGRTPLRAISPATQRVTLRAVEKASGKPVPVKLHVHGASGEYLPPEDRHRIPNPLWFQDYSVDFSHLGIHHSSYIPGETVIKLPLGRVYIEVSKGFEIKPVRKALRVTRATREITIEIEKVLPWRDKGWVSADTHVHFLSPQSALLEGAGEGVNIVNLLATQWGEMMTNVGDFDGKTTFGSKEAGGDGEYLVRVGTENRQHVMGHISLLGYGGRIITPMTTGGTDESALGDAVEVLLSQWAGQCKAQGGVVVLPHFPNPRMEGAAAIVRGDVDAVEMTAWGNLYGGIDPYSLSDWYRYLNCGYMVGAVGGTDKMTASTAVGTVRTYARIESGRQFDYESWKDAVRRADTFVTYGPLMDFSVDGRPPGALMKMRAAGGTVDVEWKLASVTVPMSRVDLVVNGEVRESQSVGKWEAEGHWSVKIDRSNWLALLVRGHYRDKPEIVAAHSSPVMVEVSGSPFFAAADAMTILEQIEGALAYIDTVGTRAEEKAYKKMLMILTSAHRDLHNRMHRAGRYHKHTPADDHGEHH